MFLITLGPITAESAHGATRARSGGKPVLATVPAAFAAAQWRLSDAGTGGRLTLQVLALPADGGAPVTALERRVNGGAWLALSDPAPGDYAITGLSDGNLAAVELRAVNSVGAGATSDVKQAIPSAPLTAPDAFGTDLWSLTDSPSTGGDTLVLDVRALPFDGGSALTALQFRIGGGETRSLAGTGIGQRLITVIAGTQASVEVRAISAIGPGPWSAPKLATPTVTPAAPLNTSLPVISGTPNVGQTLSATVGGWSGFPTPTFAFQWRRGAADIAAATAQTYALAGADEAAMISVRVTATNSEGFASATSAGVVIGAALIAPLFTTETSGSLAGRVLTIAPGVASGNPAPTLTLTALTLEGVDVLGDAVGLHYTVPDSASVQMVAWMTVAENALGQDVSFGAENVTANLFTPMFTTAPSISPASGNVGTVFTLAEGVASGNPAPTLTGVLTLDGVNVTPPGLSYTSDTVGALVWTVTAANGVAPNAEAVANASVTAVSLDAPVLQPANGVTLAFAALDPTATDVDIEIDGVVVPFSLAAGLGNIEGPSVPVIEAQSLVVLAGLWASTAAVQSFDMRISRAGEQVWATDINIEPRHTFLNLTEQTPYDIEARADASAWIATAATTVALPSPPFFTGQPSIAPASGPIGTVFTVDNGSALAVPNTVTLTRTLTLDGADVTAELAGDAYTSTAVGTLVLSVTASNGVPPDTVAEPVFSTVTAAATVPEAFAPAQWDALDATTGGAAIIRVTSLPFNGGAALSELRYSLDGGLTILLGAPNTGDFTITGLSNGVAVAVRLFAVNSVGTSAASAAKTVTPTQTAPFSWAGAMPDADWTTGASGIAGAIFAAATGGVPPYEATFVQGSVAGTLNATGGSSTGDAGDAQSASIATTGAVGTITVTGVTV